MNLSKKPTRKVAFDELQAPDLGVDTVAFTNDLNPDYEAETEATLCPICRDLLAWHEQACEALPAPTATAEPEDEAPAPLPLTPASTFAFAIGHRVQPISSAPAAITWRGQHKERHPATGLVHRVNVYFLDNGYWDCYREDELQVA